MFPWESASHLSHHLYVQFRHHSSSLVLFVSWYTGQRPFFNITLGILASAQLKAPGCYPSFDLQSRTDCLQHLILPKSRGLCPSIFQSRDFPKLSLHACETMKLGRACDDGSPVLIMVLSSWIPQYSNVSGPFCCDIRLMRRSNNDFIILS